MARTAASHIPPELLEFVRALARADAEEDVTRRFTPTRPHDARRDLRPL
jgi:hypothetical protein